jgi:L-ribulose-5-phosphate 4-epimerase
MSSDYREEREQVLGAVQRIVASGLVAGASGNVSARIRTPGGHLYAVTASRVPYHRFGINDVLVVDAEVDPVVGDGVPSSESLAHMAVYQARPDVNAVIHTHSVYASAFAVAAQPIPCVLDEQIITLGGAVAVAEYGPSASQRLAENAVAALGDRAAVLLKHHGVIGVGADLEEAVAVVELVERVAKIRLLSMQLGAAHELPSTVVGAEHNVYRMLKGFK